MSLFLPVGILLLASLAAISSVSASLFYLQLVWIAVGLMAVVLFYFFDWRNLLNYRWLIGGLYALTTVLLLLLDVFGSKIRGTRSWISLGLFNFQPVEIAKISLVLLYALYFSKKHINISHWSTVFQSFLFFAIPAALVALQPDFGSALILFGIWFMFLILSGLSGRRLVIFLLTLLIIAPIFWFNILRDYQRERIAGVFFPERNVLGINYSAAQSKIAIGSAGFWGKGYKQGTQTQLGFLTEPASDFAFAVVVEEWGIFGGLVVISALTFLIFRILRSGLGARRNFEKFVCLGVAVIFGLQFLLNAGSALGLTPIVGVTFPFISYGGSSIVASLFLLGLVAAINREKDWGIKQGQML